MLTKLLIPSTLAFLAILSASACGGTARPTPTPTPFISPQEVVRLSEAQMAALKSVAITLEHEIGTTPLMPGVVMRRLEGQVALPDRFKVSVDAEATLLKGFIQIRVIAVGDRVFMTDPLTGVWRKIAPELLPFDFTDLGVTLARIMGSTRGLSLRGEAQVERVATLHLQGTIMSNDLARLIPMAAPELTVGLELWIDREQRLLRRARITGAVVAADQPDVVRVLTFHSFDQPVEIQPPL